MGNLLSMPSSLLLFVVFTWARWASYSWCPATAVSTSSVCAEHLMASEVPLSSDDWILGEIQSSYHAVLFVFYLCIFVTPHWAYLPNREYLFCEYFLYTIHAPYFVFSRQLAATSCTVAQDAVVLSWCLWPFTSIEWHGYVKCKLLQYLSHPLCTAILPPSPFLISHHAPFITYSRFLHEILVCYCLYFSYGKFHFSALLAAAFTSFVCIAPFFKCIFSFHTFAKFRLVVSLRISGVWFSFSLFCHWQVPYGIYTIIYISLPYFMFGRALSWGSAFAVCIVHCSLVYQFEHSGKVRRAWFKFGFENFYSSLLSGSASFLCAALMSPQRTKQYCPQIEYILYIYNLIFSCATVVV